MTEKTAQYDAVDLLVQQHRQIRFMFDELQKTVGEARQDRFEHLRRFLAVHETAEELVVHPRARAGDGGEVVNARLAEERSAKKLLAELDGADTAAADFPAKLAALRTAVLDHADHEEQEEFPLLRKSTDPKTLATMARAIRAAEAMAPTHPHPGVESATANALAGPMASLVDRTRDAVRAVIGKG